MRKIKMTNGTELLLDGDLLSVLESLYIEVTAKRELERTFEDMVREIQHLIEQMNDAERRQYLSESLFLNTVSYENERLGAYGVRADQTLVVYGNGDGTFRCISSETVYCPETCQELAATSACDVTSGVFDGPCTWLYPTLSCH